MSKSTGLGARLFVAGVNLSGDIGGLSAIGSSRPTKQSTGIDKLAFERIHLLKNGRIDYQAHWNPTGAHVTLSALPTADQPVTYCHRATLGAPAASMVGKQIGYDGNRSDDGGLDFSVLAQSNGFGTEWGKLLTAGGDQLTSGSPNGSGLDFGATIGTTAFGLQAYLHVVAFTGTDVTLTIQDSDDDAATDPYADVTNAAFAQVTTAPGSQRLQTDRDESIKRWLRVAATTSGGFTSVDVVVMVKKNRVEVLF